MSTYPVDRRTRHVASNLALDTLNRITAARRSPHDENVEHPLALFPGGGPTMLGSTSAAAAASAGPVWS